MKSIWFHMQGYRDLPDDFSKKYDSIWITPPNDELCDPQTVAKYLHWNIDELEYADEVGFDGLGVNEHHQNGYPDKRAELLLGDPVSAGVKAKLALPDDAEAKIKTTLDRVSSLAAVSHFLGPIPERGLTKRLHRIKADTLIVWGEQDKLISPVYAKDFAAQIGGSRVEMIAGAGHTPQFSQPEKVLDKVSKFLGH